LDRQQTVHLATVLTEKKDPTAVDIAKMIPIAYNLQNSVASFVESVKDGTAKNRPSIQEQITKWKSLAEEITDNE